MATSFSLTRTQIANRVLAKVTKVAYNASMASADAEVIYQALDLRLKEMSKLGTFWRKVTAVPVDFSLTAGINTASAGAGDILWPLRITYGEDDSPIQILGKTEYAAITSKEAEGQPSQALWKGGSEFIFHPVPSESSTAKLLYEKIADDTSAGAAVDIDVAMIRPMMDIIKYDVADDYGIDEQTQVRWAREAAKASFPQEFGCFMRMQKGMLTELVLIPGTIQGDSHAIFQMHMLPVDRTINGSLHSHPSPHPYPSDADFELFEKYGMVHIILGHPFGPDDWRAYDHTGVPTKLEVVD